MERSALQAQVLKDYLTERVSVRTLEKRYNYHFTTIAKWIVAGKKKNHKQSITKGNQPVTTGKSHRIHELPAEIPDDKESLQEALRLAYIKIALLEATIDIADEQLGANIRKKAGARQS